MKDYSKKLFLDLDFNRQIKICLDLIYLIEKDLISDEEGSSDIKLNFKTKVSKLKEMLNWITLHPESEALRVKHLISSLDLDVRVDLRKILNIATALERRLSISLKDDSILIKTDDGEKELKPLTQKFPLYIVLDNLRSAFNVGSIFRTCECLGVEHIYLVGYTPTPEDTPVRKTAMGADEFVSWSVKERMSDVIAELKLKNVELVALETTQSSTNIYKTKVNMNTALVFGNERFGLEAAVLKKMDQVVEIPMKGLKNSLNVSNALAVSVSEIIRSWSVD